MGPTGVSHGQANSGTPTLSPHHCLWQPVKLRWDPRGSYMAAQVGHARVLQPWSLLHRNLALSRPRWDPRGYCIVSPSWACPCCAKIYPRIFEGGYTVALPGHPYCACQRFAHVGATWILYGLPEPPLPTWPHVGPTSCATW